LRKLIAELSAIKNRKPVVDPTAAKNGKPVPPPQEFGRIVSAVSYYKIIKTAFWLVIVVLLLTIPNYSKLSDFGYAIMIFGFFGVSVITEKWRFFYCTKCITIIHSGLLLCYPRCYKSFIYKAIKTEIIQP
jgi:hypothetical protein